MCSISVFRSQSCFPALSLKTLPTGLTTPPQSQPGRWRGPQRWPTPLSSFVASHRASTLWWGRRAPSCPVSGPHMAFGGFLLPVQQKHMPQDAPTGSQCAVVYGWCFHPCRLGKPPHPFWKDVFPSLWTQNVPWECCQLASDSKPLSI